MAASSVSQFRSGRLVFAISATCVLVTFPTLFLFGVPDPFSTFAAFFGHLHSIFLNFKGGKGVATAAGVMFGFSLWLGLGVLAVWIGVVWFFRYSSLGAIAAAITAPIIALATLGSGDFLTAVFCIALLLFWRHSDNLQRIRAGTEPKIGGKKNATS